MDILCELLPLLNTLNVYIRIENEQEIEEIDTTKNSLIIKEKCVKEKIIIELNEVRLVKRKYCKLSKESNWVYFRAQLETTSKMINLVAASLASQFPSLALQSNKLIKYIDVPLQMQCKCNCPLSDFIKYKKICPLPTADWDHISENWFCHLHEKEKQLIKRTNLHPQENEFYFNDLYFNVNPKSLSINELDYDLRCNRCSSVVGCHYRTTYKLWSHKVQWVDENGTLVYSKQVSEILYLLLENLEKDSVGSSLRIVLETKKPKRALLYLITMDKCLNLFVSENSALIGYIDKDSTNSFNMSLKKMKAIKVLFKYKAEMDDESGLWNDDINVHVFEVETSFFSSVLKSLELSSQCIPKSFRIVNDLNVGYVLK